MTSRENIRNTYFDENMNIVHEQNHIIGIETQIKYKYHYVIQEIIGGKSKNKAYISGNYPPFKWHTVTENIIKEIYKNNKEEKYEK